VQRLDGPTLLALTRQDLRVLDGTDPDLVQRGAYIVEDAEDDELPDVVLLGTGSEVQLCVDAATILAEQDIAARVVSMPSWELFADQDEDYQEDVLPSDVPVLSVEAATTFGWSRWADEHVGLDHFGASAPAETLFAEFGFTPEAVADAALDLLED
jgi:transketolase